MTLIKNTGIHLDGSFYLHINNKACSGGGRLPVHFNEMKCIVYREGFHKIPFMIGDLACKTHREVKEKYFVLSTYSDDELQGVVLSYKDGVFIIKMECSEFFVANPENVTNILKAVYPREKFEIVILN
jgi:hypothetical protein